MINIVLPRLRPLAVSLFAFVVVPGVTAAATMIGFLATATYLHDGALLRGDSTEAEQGGHPGEMARAPAWEPADLRPAP